jgi:rRNA maturation RNase YbeY
MINLYTETNFCHKYERNFREWIEKCIKNKNFSYEEINFIFVDEVYLHKMNIEYLQHDTDTDVITFDYTENKILSGDIYISIDRVKENAQNFNTEFYDELARVMIHGILHLMRFNDKTQEEQQEMRLQEDSCLKDLFY